MSNRYRDMIELPHPVSQTHARMSAHSRAAQFAPFAALTGFDGVIAETARANEEKSEQHGDSAEIVDHKY